MSALIVGHNPLQCLRRALGGNLRLDALSEARIVLRVASAEEQFVGGHLPSRPLGSRAVEADVRDVMLAAPVGAAAHLDMHLAYQRVGRVHMLHSLGQRPAKTHRSGYAELAAIGAGAGDDVRNFVRARAAEADVAQSLPDFVQSILRHPAECEVLLVCDARATTGVLARHICELVELPAVDVAERQPNRDGLVAVLSLRLHIALHPVLELGIAAECGVTAVERGRVNGLVLDEHQVRGVE